MARPLGAMRGTRIGSARLSPQQALFRAMGLPEYGYRWRDPARVSPQRRAELEAHDRLYAGQPATSADGTRTGGDKRGQELKARAKWRRAEFARLRAAGATIAAAAEAVGWSAKTGQRHERESRRAAAS